MKKRTICVVTGTRAEYGLLRWLMEEIKEDPDLTLQILATGMHLSPEFGQTYRSIEADGFTIDAKVEMLLSSDTPVGITKSMGVGLIGLSDAFDRLKPDLVVLLGDRFEILAAAQAAMIARIPIAHLCGGERTEGAFDEAIRHSITKMAHLHFVTTEDYARRVRQLGEDPAHIFNFGQPGLENIRRMTLLSRPELEARLAFPLGDVTFLVTYHPVTLSSTSAAEPMGELLAALAAFDQAKVIFTKPNADTGGRIIGRMIDDWVETRGGKAIAFDSLGQLGYLSALQHVSAVIGNSSSGLIEVPAFRKPSVNIGPRQLGRLRGNSVIDCDETREGIVAAIRKALSKDFLADVATTESIYGDGVNVAVRIKNELKRVRLDGLLIKRFNDLPGER